MNIHDNWWEEKRSAYLYAVMAQSETKLLHQKLFTDLQTAAEKQAAVWEHKLHEQNPQAVFTFKPDARTKLVAFLVRQLGPERVHFILSAMKIRGMSVFSKFHSEHRHTTGSSANNLRAAVFGINDGLISNMSLILGIAGASNNVHFIVLAGVAGLLAGAASMGAGEYISVRSQREVYEYQIAIEEEELREYPEEEIEELTLIYQARGIPKDEAFRLATIMINNPETGLNTLAREELGLNPDDLVSPVGAMLSSFFAFAIGAFIPLIPYLRHENTQALPMSMAFTGLTLFIIGAILSLFSNRNPILLGLRMLAVGTAAGAITYFIGRLLGISMGM